LPVTGRPIDRDEFGFGQAIAPRSFQRRRDQLFADAQAAGGGRQGEIVEEQDLAWRARIEDCADRGRRSARPAMGEEIADQFARPPRGKAVAGGMVDPADERVGGLDQKRRIGRGLDRKRRGQVRAGQPVDRDVGQSASSP
jgi:hypothetical protein